MTLRFFSSTWATPLVGSLLTALGIIGGISCTETPTTADMSRYSTVAIKPVNSRVRGTDILSDTLSDSMVSSIKAELAAKGYTVVEDPEKSDLVVSSIMQEGQTLNPSNAGTRAGQADPFPRRVSNAAFVFYLADRNGKKVWQGDSGPDMPIQSITESRISSIVRSAFDPLPGKPH